MQRSTSKRPLLKLFGGVTAVLLAIGAVSTAAPTQAAGERPAPASRAAR